MVLQFSRLYRLVAIAELRVHTINGRVPFSDSARTISGPDPEDLRFDVWLTTDGPRGARATQNSCKASGDCAFACVLTQHRTACTSQ